MLRRVLSGCSFVLMRFTSFASLTPLALFALACTTLGPMPAITALPPVPLERPGLELQAAVVPGYYLSSSVQAEPESASVPQILGLLEPDDVLGLPGLIVGARYAGQSEEGGALEPLVGYRAFLDGDRRLSVAGAGFITYQNGEDGAASFRALRGGADVGVDVRVTPINRYVELHGNGGISLTLLDAHGNYCVGTDGRFGVDCPEEAAQRNLVSGSAGGLFPAAHAGLSLDFARHLPYAFHGVRLAIDAAGGSMPTVVAGAQEDAKWYGAAGLSLTVGFGATGRARDQQRP
jgi:hypothetical protein